MPKMQKLTVYFTGTHNLVAMVKGLQSGQNKSNSGDKVRWALDGILS
jgi:hypothetical protein